MWIVFWTRPWEIWDHRWKHLFKRLRVKQEAMKAKAGPEPAPLVRHCLETWTCLVRAERPVAEVRGDVSKQRRCLFAVMPHAFFPLVKLSMWVELVKGSVCCFSYIGGRRCAGALCNVSPSIMSVWNGVVQVHFLVVFKSSYTLSVISLLIFPFPYSHHSTSGRISALEEEVKEVKSSLSKVQTEKKQLQEKLNDLEKVCLHF